MSEEDVHEAAGSNVFVNVYNSVSLSNVLTLNAGFSRRVYFKHYCDSQNIAVNIDYKEYLFQAIRLY